MENDLNTALAVSLVQNKPVGMDIVDYVTGIQSKIMEKETELFFQEFLCESESSKSNNQHPNKEDTILSCDSFKLNKNVDDNLTSLADEKTKLDCGTSSASHCTTNIIQKSNTCFIQPVITMKTLNDIKHTPIDSGYNTYTWKMDFQNTNQNTVVTMSQSIQEALDILLYTLFDYSKLLEAVTNWDDCNNIVRYFIDLVASMAESNEFAFTCRDHVIHFVQNNAFRILDNHDLFNSIIVEYQCNLLATFCYDKYIRWNIISLLINRLKIDIQIVPGYSSLRSIFYTFHLIDKLLYNVDFRVNALTQNRNNLTELWKINMKNEDGNESETMKLMIKEWKSSLEYISMEALKKNVFLVSIRANQCLESLQFIISE